MKAAVCSRRSDEIVRFRTEFRKPNFSIAEIMMLIAALAVALIWPVLLLPTLSTVLYVALDRMGFTLLGILLIVSVLGIAIGFLIPFIQLHCR